MTGVSRSSTSAWLNCVRDDALTEAHPDLQTVDQAHSATTPGQVMGTVGYMSPEQVRGQATDHRADIFALGAILYEILTGKRAFKRDSSVETMNAILKEEPPELEESCSGPHPRSGPRGTPLPGEKPATAIPVGQRHRL